jgi:hypothetical protein
MVANRTRENRLSGMKRGAWGNVAYGGTVNPPRNRKGGAGNPPPTGRRAPVLYQPSDSKLTVHPLRILRKSVGPSNHREYFPHVPNSAVYIAKGLTDFHSAGIF